MNPNKNEIGIVAHVGVGKHSVSQIMKMMDKVEEPVVVVADEKIVEVSTLSKLKSNPYIIQDRPVIKTPELSGKEKRRLRRKNKRKK